VVIDDLKHGHRDAVPQGASLVVADIADKAIVMPVLQDSVEVVMHFAAFIEAGESMEKPAKYFENNSLKSFELLKMVDEACIPAFVFSSTAAVYRSSDEPLSESSPLGPSNVYGESKKITEEFLYWYAKVRTTRVCVLRYFNAAGATLLSNPPERGAAHNSDTHLIPNILKVPLGQREKLTIFGNDYPTPDGTCIRDYIHVDDLARAHILAAEAMQNKQFNYEVFNLGNGNGFSNSEVLSAARKITGHEIPMEYGPRREGDPARLVADCTKAKEQLHWQPQHPELEVIVQSAWDWHRTHPKGYEEHV
jgi:UDP-glucose 4-epimerase